MDLSSAEKLQDTLATIVDYPLWDESPRVMLSATLAVSSLQFAAAVRALCGSAANGVPLWRFVINNHFITFINI